MNLNPKFENVVNPELESSRAVDKSLGTSPESSHEGRVRVESLRSVLESSQVTSHRGLESSHTKLSSHARVRHYIQYSLESLPITAIGGNANHCTERAQFWIRKFNVQTSNYKDLPVAK